MEKVYDKCCGIDVHKKLIVACFKKGSKQEIRDFGATTRELLEMADWLKEGGCEMQSGLRIFCSMACLRRATSRIRTSGNSVNLSATARASLGSVTVN